MLRINDDTTYLQLELVQKRIYDPKLTLSVTNGTNGTNGKTNIFVTLLVTSANVNIAAN